MDRLAKWLTLPRLPLILALLAFALAIPALWSGFLVDDYFHRAAFTQVDGYADLFSRPLMMFSFVDGDPVRTRRLMNLGVAPWWTVDGLLLAFWRPLTALTHWLDYALWPNTPSLMHLHSLLWLMILVVIAALLYRRIMGAGWVAGLAALLYAIDDAHAMPAGWLANRNALIAAVFGFAAILLHDRWRRGGRHSIVVLAVLSLGLGLLANEGALAACAYLFAYALFIDRGRWQSRALSLAPYAILVVVWRIGYQMQGFGAWGSATYIDPLVSPLAFSAALVQRAPILLLSQWAFPAAEPYIALDAGAQRLWTAIAAVVLVGLALVLLPLLRRDRVARFWCVGMVLSVVPICATFPMDRLLMFVGLGAMGLVAQLIAAGRVIGTGPRNASESSPKASREAPARRRFGPRALATFLIAVHLVMAPLLVPVRIEIWATIGDALLRSTEGPAFTEDLAGKTLIITDAPSIFMPAYLGLTRAVNHLPIPKRMVSLGPDTGFPEPLRITRTDDKTLKVTSEAGFQWLLFRDDAHPFSPGDRVELEGWSVEVLKVTDRGLPLEVTYRFDVSLDDPSFMWVEFDELALLTNPRETYAPIATPAVGESILLNQ